MRLFIVKLWLVAITSISASATESKSCSAVDLKRWDCRLKLGAAVVHVTKEKILLSDGVWRAVDDIPMDKIIEWHQVRLEKLGKRLFLILSFWDEGRGETKIQSRIWWVLEVKGAKTEVRVKQLAQRRTPQEGGKFLTDKAEETSLKKNAKGHIVWRVGRETGEIDEHP